MTIAEIQLTQTHANCGGEIKIILAQNKNQRIVRCKKCGEKEVKQY